MTYLTTDLERQRRIVTVWERRPESTEAEVLAEVDAELALEAERQAEVDAKSAQMAASLDAMFRCGACGADVVGRALCDDCGRTAETIRTERAAARTVNGRDRKELVTEWLAKVER